MPPSNRNQRVICWADAIPAFPAFPCTKGSTNKGDKKTIVENNGYKKIVYKLTSEHTLLLIKKRTYNENGITRPNILLKICFM